MPSSPPRLFASNANPRLKSSYGTIVIDEDVIDTKDRIDAKGVADKVHPNATPTPRTT